jgi:hypothetical protein
VSIVLKDGRVFDYLTLRFGRYGEIDVLGWGEYPESSVLAGQPMKVWLDSFATEEQARAAYPQVSGYSSNWTNPQPSLSHLPDEDTPAPGGMWPDDY